ncbi:MAG: FAD-dependent oxidoreductase [Magnetococcales bacterium]|nr:FAD-dependent oxidoreductase [Magnetococcales bacterium]
MSERIKVDLCVIGAGSGGLSVAAGASQMGARTVLVERHRMGGDCLNTGCVPSKALLAAAHAARTVREAEKFGISVGEPQVDMAAVHDHVHGVIAAIAPHDSVERFEGLGVRVIRGEGRFVGPRELTAGDVTIRARRFVIATGSRPLIPRVPGLDQVPFFTNETLFDNRAALPHLLIIGGGPIGLEMAQAHRRLGAAVTVVDQGRILPRDDPELTAVVADRLTAEGVTLRQGVTVTRAERDGAGIAVVVGNGRGESEPLRGSHLLVAAGRRPNLETLNLEAAEVDFTSRGITVDARLRTRNRRIFAIGDVAGPYLFTHAAGYQAGIVLRNALFRIPTKVDYRALPWTTYTDPELAHVGLAEAAARAAGEKVTVLRKSFAENDRARAEGATEGLIKVVVGQRGRILGASIVGSQAGELLQPWILAMQQGLGIGAMATVIAPYPTRGEIGKAVAGAWYTPTLFAPRTQRLVRFLSLFG